MRRTMGNILIHALGADKGGGLRHLTNFLPELGRQDPETRYRVLIRESVPDLSLTGNVTMERVPDRHASRWAGRLAHDLVALPRRLAREHHDVIVSLTNTGPVWSPIRHVFFQRNAKYYSPYYLSGARGRGKTETLLRRRVAIECMKRADVVVTPSLTMTQMIRDACPQVSSRRFTTLYHGFAPGSLCDDEDPKWARLLDRPGVKLLYPTHAASYKGFDVLFKMVHCLIQTRYHFTLFATIDPSDWPCGVKEFERQIDSLGIHDHVVFTGRVPQGQMGHIYRKCDLMVYPSLCESFGFSMIEAMGFGLPIVAADTAINREMCGAAALYYPPLDAVAGAGAVQQALEPSVSARLTASARGRIASFDWGWPRYARQFTEMIREILSA
jgi:glycosyltransferase involved in cell wall biosynthesis